MAITARTDERSINLRSDKYSKVCKGLCKSKKFSKNPSYYGSGWVGPGLTPEMFF